MSDAPPAYLALDLWMALGISPSTFDGYYERNGWAETWSNLLAAVRARSGIVSCPYWVDSPREHCVLVADHRGPCMGYSDVGSSEPLPKPQDSGSREEGR